MIRLTVLLVSLAAPLAAETLEAAAGGAYTAFAQLQTFKPAKLPPRVVRAGFQAPSQDAPLVVPISLTPTAGSVSGLVKEVALAPLLNKHLKTSLTFPLGGATVWISGAFDRQQSAFVSVLVDGQPAKFFNVKDLLTAPQILDIGTLKYRLSLSPDLVDQLQSEIVLTNTANRRDQQRITLQEMLEAVSAAGEAVDVTGQSYRMFYYDDVAGGTRSLCFILKDAKGELHIFLVPAELVPAAGKPAVFKMFASKPIGLIVSGGKLQIHE